MGEHAGREAQLFLGLLLLGDIARNAKGADDPALLVAQRNLGGRNPGIRLVEPGFPLLNVQRLAGANDLQFIGAGLLRVRRREEIEIRLADRSHGIVQSKERGLGTADTDDGAAPVLEIDVIRDVIHQRLQQETLLGQRLALVTQFLDFLVKQQFGLQPRRAFAPDQFLQLGDFLLPVNLGRHGKPHRSFVESGSYRSHGFRSRSFAPSVDKK